MASIARRFSSSSGRPRSNRGSTTLPSTSTIASIQTILKNVADGKGTLGKILTNDQAWNELVRILVLARETVEDLREQAPISTFVNALFATF